MISPINVTSYPGVDPTGAADSTVAIQACFTSNPGREVFFPAGVYAISGPITVSGGIVGEGPSSTTIQVNGGGYDAITLNADCSYCDNIGFTSPTYRPSGVTVKFANSRRFQKLTRFSMSNQFMPIQNGVGTVVTEISSGEILNTTPGANNAVIDIVGGNDTFINKVLADNPLGSEPSWGIRINQSNAVWMTDNDMIHCGNGLGIVPNGPSGEVTFIFGINNAFDSSASGTGVYIRPTNGAKVKGVQLIGNWSATNVVGCSISTDRTSNTLVDGVQFSSSRFLNNKLEGVILDCGSQGKNIDFDDCSILSNSRDPVGSHAGFLASTDSQSFRIRGGRSGAGYGFGPRHSYGVIIAGNCSDYEVNGVDLRGNITGGLQNLSPQTENGRIRDNVGYVTPWTTTNPIPVALSGSFVSAAAVVNYRRTSEGLVHYSGQVSVPAGGMGTATGAITVAMPFASADNHVAAARNIDATGQAGVATMYAGAPTLYLTRYDNGTLVTGPGTVAFSGTYRVA
ncbi:glycosyl hydrolase family 28-related protein [Brevundimonas sp.]|uniref:glycosyl hydrolase family 28-related protein n=1 Tax=Brevundimonas sp. TaxID=1871086 RepID=UPI003D1364C5